MRTRYPRELKEMSIKDIKAPLDSASEDLGPLKEEVTSKTALTDEEAVFRPRRMDEHVDEEEERVRRPPRPSRGTLFTDERMEKDLERTDERRDIDDVTMTNVTTPSTRNKRKRTEPKKRRTDFSIRSLCSNSEDEEEEEEQEDEDQTTGSGGEKRETESGNRDRSKRRRDAEESRQSVISTSRREEDNFRHHGSESGSSGQSSFFPAAYPPYVPLNATAASMVYQGSCGVTSLTSSSLLSPFPLGSMDSIVGAIPPPPPPTTATDHRRCSVGGVPSSTAVELRRPGRIPSSPAFSFDGSPPTDDDHGCPNAHPRRPRKNYKNMTKQRRIEANERERNRVHTISAAFESLRRAVPSYAYNQRLSKLAILRIACSYILALARLAELDYSQDQSRMTFSDCVDLCTQTIQAEGKAKRRH